MSRLCVYIYIYIKDLVLNNLQNQPTNQPTNKLFHPIREQKGGYHVLQCLVNMMDGDGGWGE